MAATGGPRWYLGTLAALVAEGALRIAGVVEVAGRLTVEEPRSFQAYRRRDQVKHRRPGDPLELVSSAALPSSGAEIRRGRVEGDPLSAELDADSIAFIRSIAPDLILSALPHAVRGEAAGLARFGLWHVYHDVIEGVPTFPAGYWPLQHGAAVTTIELHALAETPADDLILGFLHCATDQFSLYRGEVERARSAGGMLKRATERLHRTGTLQPTAPPRPPRAERVSFPDEPSLLRLRIRQRVHWMRRSMLDRFHKPEWHVALHVSPAAAAGPCTDLRKFSIIPVERGTFQADPCVVVDGDTHYIFLEEFIWAVGRGRVSVMELRPDGTTGPLRPVLERPYHLSYPFVFRWDGNWYMIPETMDHGTVELYRASSFPDEWEFVDVLLDNVRACDATVHEEGGTWWMFVTLAHPGAAAVEELHLFSAASPLGPWQPHPENPVKADVRGARPAGGLTRIDNRLYRPGQDSAAVYGHFIRMFEVTQLDPTRYEEREAMRIGPSERNGFERVHTISHAGRVTAVDLWRWKPIWT